MTRARFTIAFIGLLLAKSPAADAVPLDIGATCGNLFPSQIRVASSNGLYPVRWITPVVKGQQVTVSLVVTTPRGDIRYDGFRCQISRNGKLSALPLPQ